MAEADWDVFYGGNSMDNVALAHQYVLNQQLDHDYWSRKFINDESPAPSAPNDHGRASLIYKKTPPAPFLMTHDISIRAAVCAALRQEASHSIGIGTRLNTSQASSGNSNKPEQFSPDGYQLMLIDGGVGATSYELRLSRVLSGSSTLLMSFSDTEWAYLAGVVGEWKWFHIRLDMIIQLSGKATLQVFYNDITQPDWNTSPTWHMLGEIEDDKDYVPSTYTGVGIGSQVKYGATWNSGGIDYTNYETYADWVEIFYVTG